MERYFRYELYCRNIFSLSLHAMLFQLVIQLANRNFQQPRSMRPVSSHRRPLSAAARLSPMRHELRKGRHCLHAIDSRSARFRRRALRKPESTAEDGPRTPSLSPGCMFINARPRMFSNSRTLPGQLYEQNRASASGVIPSTCRLYSRLSLLRREFNSGGISSRRSRKGGIWIGRTCSR